MTLKNNIDFLSNYKNSDRIKHYIHKIEIFYSILYIMLSMMNDCLLNIK